MGGISSIRREQGRSSDWAAIQNGNGEAEQNPSIWKETGGADADGHLTLVR